jgi:hypothetical protein
MSPDFPAFKYLHLNEKNWSYKVTMNVELSLQGKTAFKIYGIK